MKLKKKPKTLHEQILGRLVCPHWYWRNASSLEMGSFCRGVIVCCACGKTKLIEELKSYEIIV